MKMKNYITQKPLTAERKASIYEAFAKHAIDSVGFDGLAQEPVAFEMMMENDLSLGWFDPYKGTESMISGVDFGIKSYFNNQHYVEFRNV